MIDLVQRLRFDAARCEAMFSKGVATNIEEAAAEIERLQAALKPFADAANDAEGYPDDHPVGCDPCMELAVQIEDGALAPLKVRHLREAKSAFQQSGDGK